MTLGIALIVIFVLYLIDKHNRWLQTLKIFVSVIVLGILVTGGWFGWEKFQAYRAKKRSQAEAAAFRTKVKACIAKSTPAGNATAAKEEEDRCEENPDSPIIVDFGKAVPLKPWEKYARPTEWDENGTPIRGFPPGFIPDTAVPTVQGVISDPKFQALSLVDKIEVLSNIDPEFAKLSGEDQRAVVTYLGQSTAPRPLVAKLPDGTPLHIVATLPDGTELEFPGNTSLDVVQRVVKTELSGGKHPKPPPVQPKKP